LNRSENNASELAMAVSKNSIMKHTFNNRKSSLASAPTNNGSQFYDTQADSALRKTGDEDDSSQKTVTVVDSEEETL
jgi:hypothetical protein